MSRCSSFTVFVCTGTVLSLLCVQPVAARPSGRESGPALDAPRTIAVRTPHELEVAVRSLRSHTTILIDPGIYRLERPLRIAGPISNVVLRATTGRSGDVVLTGAVGLNADHRVRAAIETVRQVDGLRVEHLTIREFSEAGIRLAPGATAARLYDLHFVDAGRQFVAATGSAAGLVDQSVFELTEERVEPATAIAIRSGAGWTVRSSVFRNFRPVGAAWSAPVLLISGDSPGGDIDGNLFLHCQWEVAVLGRARERAGSYPFYVRNNFVVRDSWVGGVPAIQVDSRFRMRIVHNSILLNGSSVTAVDVQAPAHGVVVRNNLLDAEVTVRSGARALVADNRTDASPAFFVDSSAGDLHLAESVTTILGGAHPLSHSTLDRDGDLRAVDSTADYGADEWSGASGIAPTHTARPARSVASAVTAALAGVRNRAGSASAAQTVTFVASRDHRNVRSYVFEVFEAGTEPGLGSPVKTQNLGRPAVMNGEITADVAYTIRSLGRGSYFATVRAVGAVGSSRSAPSNLFSP